MGSYHDVLITGTFQLMKEVYMCNLDGKGNRKKGKRNDTAWRGAQRSVKAKNRMEVIKASQLPVEDFRFIGDLSYALPDHSNCNANSEKNCLMVHEPLFHGQKASELVLVVDCAHIAHRAHTSKSQFTCVKYSRVVIPGPKMKIYLIPIWSIPRDYEQKHPKEFDELHNHINFTKTVMPNTKEVELFLHKHKAKACTYIDHGGSVQVLDGPSTESCLASTSVEPQAPIPHPLPTVPQTPTPAILLPLTPTQPMATIPGPQSTSPTILPDNTFPTSTALQSWISAGCKFHATSKPEDIGSFLMYAQPGFGVGGTTGFEQLDVGFGKSNMGYGHSSMGSGQPGGVFAPQGPLFGVQGQYHHGPQDQAIGSQGTELQEQMSNMCIQPALGKPNASPTKSDASSTSPTVAETTCEQISGCAGARCKVNQNTKVKEDIKLKKCEGTQHVKKEHKEVKIKVKVKVKGVH
ncbi:hypothetical protein RSAG8_10184, partial [Rhizoctonia solani AG-8 WAC10335]